MDAFTQAVAYEKAGNYQEAYDLLLALVRTAPQFAPAWTHLAAILLIWGRTLEALHHYDQAVQLDVQDAYAWEGRARCLMLLQRNAEALAATDQALALNPQLPETLYIRGRVLSESDDTRNLQSALACLDHALRLNPNHADAMTYKAKTLSLMGRWDEAYLTAEQAVRVNPNNPVGWRAFAMAQWMRREFDGALFSLDCAARLGAHDAEIWVLRGGILQNKYTFVHDRALLDQAISAFDQALALHPGDPDIVKARQECTAAQRGATTQVFRIRNLVVLMWLAGWILAIGAGPLLTVILTAVGGANAVPGGGGVSGIASCMSVAGFALLFLSWIVAIGRCLKNSRFLRLLLVFLGTPLLGGGIYGLFWKTRLAA